MSVIVYVDSELGRGTSRIAYDGIVQRTSAQVPLPAGTRVAVKVVKAEVYNQGARLSMLDFTVQNRAQILSEVFTSRSVITIGSATFAVLFQTTYLCSFTREFRNRYGSLVINAGEQVLIERKMVHPFMKFNSNTGWSINYAAADFFSHWTLWYTNGSELVCDLQGSVCNGNGSLSYGSWYFTHYLYLTDPAILSVSKKWGATDLGGSGIAQWMMKHQCNHLCRGYGLTNYTPRKVKPARQVMRGTVAYYREAGHKKKACTLL